MKKRVFSLVVALALCLGLLPRTVWAAESVTDSLDFTVENPTASGDGYTWDSESNTLTLTDFSQEISTDRAIAIVFPSDSTLVLEGESTINHSGYAGTCIQYSDTLNIQGDGTLNLNLNMPTEQNGGSTCGKGIYEKSDRATTNILTIKSGTLNITGKADDTSSQGYVGLSGAEVHLDGGTVNMKNVTYGINASYWWVEAKKFFMTAGALNISSDPNCARIPAYAVNCRDSGEVSISGGSIDISGVEYAFSIADTPVTVSGGSLNIHDLIRRKDTSTTRAFFDGSGNMSKPRPVIDLSGGDISISDCDYILDVLSRTGLDDVLKLPAEHQLTGAVKVDQYGIYSGQENLGVANVRFYGEYTLPESMKFHGGYSGFWNVDLAPGCVLTIPDGRTLDLSQFARTGEDFEIDGPGDTYDFSKGKIINNGTLYLPEPPVTTPEHIATLNIIGGKVALKGRLTGTETPLHRITYKDGNEVVWGGLVYEGTAIPPTLEKNGYVFSDWYQSADFTGDPWDFSTNTIDSDMTFYSKWDAQYTVAFHTNGGSAVDSQSVIHGETAQKPADPVRNGYDFQGWYTAAEGGEAYDFSTAVTEDLMLYARWTEKQTAPVVPDPDPTPSRPSGSSSSSGSSTPTTYKPSVTQPDHGSVTVTPSRPKTGDTVTVKPVPDEGYEVDRVTVTDRNGKSVAVTQRRDGSYTFTQPASLVTIQVELVPLAQQPWTSPYTDVTSDVWYADAVQFVTENGLMDGVGGGHFLPDQPLTRAQLAQILYNQAGRPSTNSGTAFADVGAGAWYTGGVAWAASNGIVSGYGDGRFGPDDNITREQLAVMLWRYAGQPAPPNLLLRFTDADSASEWALDALRWAVDQGIMSGRAGNILDPKGQATRAEAAQMLKQYMERN